MSIDFRQEELLSMGEAAKTIPSINGKTPNKSSLWRWCIHGIQGVKLDYVRVGSRVCTSAEAIDRFLESVSHTSKSGNTV